MDESDNDYRIVPDLVEQTVVEHEELTERRSADLWHNAAPLGEGAQR